MGSFFKVWNRAVAEIVQHRCLSVALEQGRGRLRDEDLARFGGSRRAKHDLGVRHLSEASVIVKAQVSQF